MQNFDFNMDQRQPAGVKEDAAEDTGNNQENKRKETNEKKNNKKFKSNKNGDNEEDEANESGSDLDNNDGSVVTHYTAKAINLQPGHTGFLTFATLLHKDF